MARRRRTALWSLTSAALAAALFAGLWRTSDLGRASSDLERQWTAAKREGVPTEYADLHRLTPPVPEDRNAAVVYRDAFATYHKFGALKGVKADALVKALPDGKAKPDEIAALRAGLQDVGPALDLAREGSRRPDFSFDRPWEQGTALLFPEYSDARSVGRALALRAMLATNPKAAADDLRTVARMRNHVGSEPVIIAALVGAAMETDLHRTIRFLGVRGPVWAAALAPVLNDLAPIPSLRRSLAGEAVWSMQIDRELARYGASAFTGMDGSATPPAMRLVAFSPVRAAMKERVVEYWRGVWAKLPQGPTNVRTVRTAMKVPDGKGLSYGLRDFLLPVFDGFAETGARTETDRRLTRMALAIDAGRAPTPERDPFGDGSLKVRHDAKGWILWSVGPDGVDQGGKPKTKQSDPAYDLVAPVPTRA